MQDRGLYFKKLFVVQYYIGPYISSLYKNLKIHRTQRKSYQFCIYKKAQLSPDNKAGYLHYDYPKGIRIHFGCTFQGKICEFKVLFSSAHKTLPKYIHKIFTCNYSSF